jgi:hypothetical protein
LAIVVNRCTRRTSKSFMAEKGRVGCVQEQDCLIFRFQVMITKSPPTGISWPIIAAHPRPANRSWATTLRIPVNYIEKSVLPVIHLCTVRA